MSPHLTASARHLTASARPQVSAPPRALVPDPLPPLTRRRAAALFDDEAGPPRPSGGRHGRVRRRHHAPTLQSFPALPAFAFEVHEHLEAA